jgi:DnaJ-class molecular chaperone
MPKLDPQEVTACEACDGTGDSGDAACPTCNGVGELLVNGWGEVCDDCQGDGKEQCRKCHGSGLEER